MEESYRSKYLSLENYHWWFKARRDMIFKLLKRENKNSHILDAGCSGGALVTYLHKKNFKHIYGIDIDHKSIEHCNNNGLDNVFLMNCTELMFDDESFDIVICSDVLEHVSNDVTALKEFNRVLKPNGIIILFVPAFNFLWSVHDQTNRHYRRYVSNDLICKLRANGFKIEKSTYWNVILFMPILIMRKLTFLFKNKKDDQLYEFDSLLNSILTNILKFENAILQMVSSPVGVSVLIVARKKYQ